jgi:transcriptional regulator of heat shock response
MRKKKEKQSEKDFEIKIPSDSDLPERIKRISGLTGLSDYELVQKWLVQEESVLNTSRYYVETIQSRLQENFTEQLRSVLREFQKTVKPKAVKETKETKPEKPENYRQTLSQRIQNMRDEGMSFVKIADQLNQEGVSTVSGSGKWYASSVFQLLAK